MSRRWLRWMLIAALAVGPAVWFSLTWLAHQRLNGRAAAARAEVDRLHNRIARLRETPATPIGETAAPQWRLGDKAQVAALMRDLETLGRVDGLELDAVRAPPSSTVGRLGFALAGRGSPAAVCTLLSGIEAHATVFVVEAARFIPRDDCNIAFELVVASYYRVEGGDK